MSETSSSATALLLIDVINDMDFPESGKLLEHARPAAEQIAGLRERARSAGIPVIYVNDNFGRWKSDLHDQIRRCTRPDSPGCDIATRLLPEKDDYFVLKPKHSGFYGTPLDFLLEFLKVETLILTGFAADICVLYTANDAYMRNYRLIVPADCVAAEDEQKHDMAVSHMRDRLKARICLARELP